MKSIRILSKEEKFLEQVINAINTKNIKKLAKLMNFDAEEDCELLNDIINEFGDIKSYEVIGQGYSFFELQFEFKVILQSSKLSEDLIFELEILGRGWRLVDIQIDGIDPKTDRFGKYSMIEPLVVTAGDVCADNSTEGH